MKQTNSAIKFLLAQYRAIFKNANLKMFIAAATAAAAIGATSAQAAEPPIGSNLNPKPVLTEELKDSVLGKGEELIQSGNAAIIPDAPAGRPIVVNGGKIEMTTNARQHIMLNNDIILQSGSIAIAGDDTNKAGFIPGLVGGPKDISGYDQAPLTSSLTVAGGSVNVSKGFILMKDVNLIGGETTLGGYITSSKQGMGGYSNVYADEGTLTIGGDATVNLNAASGLYGNLVNINGGTINFKGEGASGLTDSDKSGAYIRAGNSILKSSVNINGGTINVDASKYGTVFAETVNMNGGTVNVKTGANLVIGKNTYSGADGQVNLVGGTINNSGSLTLDGDAKIADGVIKTAAGSTLSFGTITAKHTRTATLSAEALKSALAANVSGSGGDASSSIFEFELTDSGELDLETLGLVQSTGERNANFKITTANVALTGNNAKYHQNQFNDATIYDFNTMSVGKDGQFTLKGGADVIVHNALNVIKDAATESKITVESGSLTLDGSGTVAADTIVVSGANTADASLDIKNGTWNVKNLTVNSGSTSLTDATLNIAGKLTTAEGAAVRAAASNIRVDGANASVAFGSGSIILNNTSKLYLDKADIMNTAGTALDTTKFSGGVVSADDTSSIVLNNLNLTKQQFSDFVTATGFNGMFEGVSLSDMGDVSGKHSLADIMSNIGTGYEKTQAEVTVADGVSGNYSVGSVILKDAGDDVSLKNGGSLTLQNASAGATDPAKHFFVTKADGSLGGVKFENDKFLTLEGSGQIGSITATATGAGTVTIGAADHNANVTVDGSIGTANGAAVKNVVLNANSSATVKSGVNTGNINLRAHSSLTLSSGGLTAKALQMDEGASIVAKTQEITLGTATGNNVSTIKGNIEAKKLSTTAKTSDSDTFVFAGGSKVKLESLVGSSGATFKVGRDASDAEPNGSTATIITDVLDLNNGKLFIDPEYNQPAALVLAKDLKRATSSDPSKAGSLTGKVFVGKNSALGVGVSSEAELYNLLQESHALEAGGRFTENGTANAVVLNKAITIASGSAIVLDKTYSDTKVENHGKKNEVVVGFDSVLVITDKAFMGADGKKNQAAITFADSSVTTAGTDKNVTLNNGILLVGNFSAKDENLKIFEKTTGADVSVGGNYRFAQTPNGLLKGEVGANGVVAAMTIDPKVAAVSFLNTASPVRQLLLDTKSGSFVGNTGAGLDFLHVQAGTDGLLADAAAHGATYAGAQQAAVAAVGTMADAIGGRVGSLGAEAATIAATGSQANGGVWVSPMYKSVNSDGFNAQGASYGADVDLAGVAFGADTVNGNMRFGALFNIGSGDADGKGNGAGLKDEFDYYGFGIYSAMGFSDFALVGDASVNVISHDIEGAGFIASKADTTALTMGVTGQYTIATPMVDVVPHLGMRFTRLDTDSYELSYKNKHIANTDFDVQNVFSIPLGVTLSKAFVTESWTFAPTADFTLTFNTGDTEAKSSTYFTGARTIGLSTEVLDEVTYGVAFAVAANFGSFGANFGVNYTGSENSDSFGVNAQARYMF